MAINRATKYPGRFDNATPEQPEGAFKNRTTDISKDGSYLEKDWLNDWSAFFSSLLSEAGLTANDVVDTVGSSQYFEGFQKSLTAVNKIKTSQFVVEGNTGNPLPENGSTEDYADANELAFGWIADGAVVAATKDVNGNLTATSGIVTYYIDKDENDTVSTMYGSVMQYDGANYTQIYATGANGLTVLDEATRWGLQVDLSQVSGVVFGLSETFGILSIDSVDDVTINSLGALSETIAANGYTIHESGRIEQWGSIAAGVAGVDSATFPIAFPNGVLNSSATIVGTTIVEQSLALHVTVASNTEIVVSKLFTTNGGAVGDASQGWNYRVIGW